MSSFQKIKTFAGKITLRQILLLAFILRISWYLLILFTNPDGFWLYDSYGYWNIAYNVNEYGVFSQDVVAPLTPDCFRTPLYPLFILPTVWFDANGYSIPVLQILVDCFTCWLIYKTILLVSKENLYAKAGAFIYAIHIPAIVMCNFVLSESLFAFCLMLFLFLFIRFILDFGYKNALLAGLAGGLCVMCKPLGFVLIFPSILFVLLLHKINFKTISATLLLITGFYAMQYPWLQRNKNLYGHYFNSVLGEHLLLGYHASTVYAKANSISFNAAQEILRDAFIDDIDYDPYAHPYEYAKLIERKSYEIFLANKTIFVKEHLKETLKFFVQPLRGYVQAQLGKTHGYSTVVISALVILQLLVLSFIYFTLLFCLFLYLRKKIKFTGIHFFIFSIVLIFSQFNTMPFTDGRIRFPIEPLLIILAVLGIRLICRRKNVLVK